ncbi:hypothetical protein [Rathayibacter agropyri]|uniref:hypothetical protein n=1 Tax=Rathayibacter agropyri TaxID=1634927 RepID=UPI0015633A14|nr:hypothetical protein [Rathayibacter agropyri]NRD08994.1 hypothetical protein [Rathayibacter agropyri]
MTQQFESTRKIHVGGEWVIPADGGFDRRTLVEGAAWSIPVVAVALATPAAAASTAFVCPSVPASSGWTGAQGITGDSSGPGKYYWNQEQWDNGKDATQSGSLEYYIEFSFKGVAGHTYNFSWSAYANGADAAASYVAYDTVIDGKTVYTASSDSTYGGGAGFLDPNTSAPVAASATFTPTVDGTYTFRYKIRLSQLKTSQHSNHNILIKMPALTCS